MFSFVKKSALFLFVLALAVGSAWYFFKQNEAQAPVQNPLFVVQNELDLAGQINQLSRLNELENATWLKTLQENESWANKLALLDFQSDSPLYFFTTKAATNQLIFAFGFQNNERAETAIQKVFSVLGAKGSINGENFETNGSTKLFGTFHEACVFVSSAPISLTWEKDKNPFFTQDDLNVWDTRADLNLWLNSDYGHVSSEGEKTTCASAYFADLNFQENGISITGLAHHPEAKNYLFGERRWGHDLKRYLPENAVRFHQEHAISPKNHLEQYQARLAEKNQLSAHNARQAELEQENALVLQEVCLDWSTGSMMRFEANKAPFLLLEMADSLAFGEAISQLPDVSLQAEEGHFYFRWSDDALWQNCLAPPFNLALSWGVLRGNAVVFANSLDDLKWYSRQMDRQELEDWIDQKSAPIEIKLQTKNESNPLVNINLSLQGLDWSVLQNAFKEIELSIDLEEDKKSIFQAKLFDGEKSKSESEGPNIRWEYLAEDRISSSPVWLKDHRSNAHYLVFQDVKNKLVALNEQGKKIWEKSLPGEIQSEITQIDLYRNGKFQIIFNTASSVHCIDVLGKDVPGYPLNLSSESSSPLAVFDYDDNRKYRFLIGLKNGSVMNFQDEGKTTKGWNYKSKGSAINDLRHIKAGNKDYIFTKDDEGKIRLLKRNGEDRFISNAQAPKQAKELDFFMKDKIDNSSFVLSDTTGQIIEILFADGTNGRMTGLAHAEHLLLADFDEDRLNDLILSSGQSLEVYNSARQRILKYKSSSPISQKPQVYKFPEGKLIGLLMGEEKSIIFVDASGNMYFNKALFGMSMPSIRDANGDGTYDIVTHDGGKTIICYKF